jgi:hypothetical protein
MLINFASIEQRQSKVEDAKRHHRRFRRVRSISPRRRIRDLVAKRPANEMVTKMVANR